MPVEGRQRRGLELHKCALVAAPDQQGLSMRRRVTDWHAHAQQPHRKGLSRRRTVTLLPPTLAGTCFRWLPASNFPLSAAGTRTADIERRTATWCIALVTEQSRLCPCRKSAASPDAPPAPVPRCPGETQKNLELGFHHGFVPGCLEVSRNARHHVCVVRQGCEARTIIHQTALNRHHVQQARRVGILWQPRAGPGRQVDGTHRILLPPPPRSQAPNACSRLRGNKVKICMRAATREGAVCYTAMRLMPHRC